MILEIPIDATEADFVQSCSLDGSTYLLDFSWSYRSESWYVSLYLLSDDATPAPISTGLRISTLYPLLMGVTESGRPPGELFALDLNNQGDPGRDDLGGRVKLYYFDLESLNG